jgi:uncharacterized membrane protein
VPALGSGATNTKTVTVTIPSKTGPGPYRLMVCADDRGVVAEVIETNNCLASAATIQVTP